MEKPKPKNATSTPSTRANSFVMVWTCRKTGRPGRGKLTTWENATATVDYSRRARPEASYWVVALH